MALFKKKSDQPVEPPINLHAVADIDAERAQREIAARQTEAGFPTKDLLYDAVVRRAEKVLLDYSRDAVAVQYQIDGLWHNVAPRDRATGDALLAMLKLLCGLRADERRARQDGKFLIEHQQTKVKYVGTLTAQGVKTGERVVLELAPKKAKPFKTLTDLGMREPMQEKILSYTRDPGLLLISSPPANGFTTTWNVTLKSTDRMLRDFVGIEDEAKKETEVENINMTYFNGAAGETPDALIPKLLLKLPDCFVLPDLCNAATANKLSELASHPREPRLVIAGVRAKDAVEALLRVLLLKASAKDFAQAVRAVLSVRLVRKLNDTCKQTFQPPPQLLQRLGIPPDRVKVLYKEWTPPPPLPPEEEKKKKKKVIPPHICPLCEQEGPWCHGIGYRDRTGIFELLEINDQLREALVKTPKLEVLRQIARAAGHRGLQEEGIVLVAKGTTSLTELQRVLK